MQQIQKRSKPRWGLLLFNKVYVLCASNGEIWSNYSFTIT